MDGRMGPALVERQQPREQKYCTTAAAAVGHGQKQGKQKSYVRIAMPLFDDDPRNFFSAISHVPDQGYKTRIRKKA